MAWYDASRSIVQSLRWQLDNTNLLAILKFPAFIRCRNFGTGTLTLTGWTMIFKVVGGASPPEVGQLWTSSQTHSENIHDALDTSTTHNGHYKNRIVINWQTFQPQQVRNYTSRKKKKRLKKDHNAIKLE